MMANKKARRRRFGALRELPSGQWQARYRGPDGVMRPADKTYPSKTDALAEVIDPRYSALVLLGTFGSLRWGELAALRRSDVDLASCTIRVERQLTEMPGGGYACGPPKSDASVRTVSIPNLVVPRIRWHLSQFAKQDPEALVFTAPTGTPLRHGNFRRRFWLPALKAAGLPMIHFHDLPYRNTALYQFRCRSEPSRADGADGPQHDPGRSGLPPLDQRASAGHRRCGRQGGSRHPAQDQHTQNRSDRIWHESGTTPQASVLAKHDPRQLNSVWPGISGERPTATRTRDLLLRRHSRNAARRRLAWPDVPVSCSDNGWMWPGVVPRLWSLAPR